VIASPSHGREEVLRSLEQIRGSRAYAAGGWSGGGLVSGTILGRGVPITVSYAENTFAVYVLGEHGIIGGWVVLSLYAALALLVIRALWLRPTQNSSGQHVPISYERLAVIIGAGMGLVVPAIYVAASNIALVPLTGQNMPFLGLNSWSDVLISTGLVSALVMALVAPDLGSEEHRATAAGQ
jgi:cell division protein FtsW (lipid II flippase)